MKIISGILLFIFIAILNIVSIAQGNWTRLADFGGAGSTHAVGFSIGDKGYIGTGAGNQGIRKDFWEFDPATNTWTQKADFAGAARRMAVGFSINGKGYIGTGRTFQGIMLKDFWEYDPLLNSWTQKADFGGVARESGVGFSIGNKGYIGTGHVQSPLITTNDFWEYDPSQNSWNQKADFIGGGRYSAVGFSIKEKGYIGTGTDSLTTLNLSDFYEYNPSSNQWIQKSNIGLGARVGATGFSMGGKGYIGLGHRDGFGYLKDMLEYDPAIDQWKQGTAFRGVQRIDPIGFSIGEKGFIGTGAIGEYLADFWQYTICKSPIVNNLLAAPAIINYCVSGSPDSIKGTLPTGGAGAYLYEWLTSSDGKLYSTIAVTMGQNFIPNTVTSTRYFTRVVHAGVCFDTSNVIKIVVSNAGATPAITISTRAGAICRDTVVTFTATTINAGSSPGYQWKKNGLNVGTNTPSYTTDDLATNDVINCVMTSNSPCEPATVASNNIALNFGGAFAYIPTESFNPEQGGIGYNQQLMVINTATNTIVDSVAIRDSCVAQASKDGKRIYLAQRGLAGKLFTINTATNTIVDSLSIGSWPGYMMISPDGTKLYVGTGNGLTVVNTITNSITANIPDVANSALGCISTDGGKVYVVDYPGEAVTVINTATNSVTAMIGISGYPAGLCIAPNKNKMYVINYDKTVSVVSTATNTVESVFSLNTTPTGIRISADGSRLYIMHYGLPDDNLGSISVVNTADNSPVALILLNHKPVGMSIDPGAAKIFVTHTDVPLVSVINTITNQLVDSIALGHLVAVPGDFISNVSPCASCANNYWLGTASNAWENTANWSCNTLPGPTTNVIINSGTVVLNSNTTVNTLIVNPGVSFTINTGFKLDVLH